VIRKSFDELITQLIAPATPSDRISTIGIELNESGGHCTWCRKKIKRKHQSWEWEFDKVILRMHLWCFADWFSRIMPDVTKAVSLTEEERAK
jgi:hypothetical protein